MEEVNGGFRGIWLLALWAIVVGARQEVLNAAYAAHPECFVRKPPVALPLPEAVWINPPPKEVQTEHLLQ